MSTIEYGKYAIDTTKLPEASIIALLSRGVSHVLGNEASALVASHFRSEAVKAWQAANPDKDLDKETRAKITGKDCIPDTESAEYIAAKAEAQAAKYQDILDGSLGIREGRAPVDPLEAEMEKIAREEALGIIRLVRKANDGSEYAFWTARANPKDDTEINLGNEVDTFGNLVDRRLAKNHERIAKQAQKRLAEREANKAKAAKDEVADAF